jgi:hypothetical protein
VEGLFLKMCCEPISMYATEEMFFKRKDCGILTSKASCFVACNLVILAD